ncbi:JHL10I11.10 protein, putative isoform 1 [Theobroma cacao]|uniref:JHL10I11.10 protein, putative isoform 1 n=1 Tax=Theobroma cacao TaxID=3641 RepID=A0A061FYA3_THECC|nr:JHL10I11.10 protein, putative isoform 1 [Theobroma cacao]
MVTYQANWARTCDTCQAAACTLYCHTDSSYLCNDCDKRIHAANPMASSHQRVWICAVCENAAAAVTCRADAASLCIKCDIEIHSVNPLARRHIRVPIPPLSGLACSSSSTHQVELPDPMFDTENEIAAGTINEEIDENETDCWLLLEPDSTDNQTMSGFTYGEQVDEYMDVRDTCTEYRCQEQCSDQQQLLCVNNPEDSGSDIDVPVQTFESKKQSQQQEKQLQRQTHQQLQGIYFNTEHRGSKAAFMYTPSSTLSARGAQPLHQCSRDFPKSVNEEQQTNGIYVPLPLITAGILPNATSNIPSTYTGFPNGATDLFPYPLPLMPLQFTPMNREAKVLRYREKRKARKFEKKIRYASRKAYAETRPRVKGRFARKTDMEIEDDQLFSKEDYGYCIVPSL